MTCNWHRLFGIFLMDFFIGSDYEVELEKDLSLKQQFLDVVILHKQQGNPIKDLPDGFDNLNVHNLLSYKSLHEPFDAWALNELIGHYVNYRKQVSPSFNKLLPEKWFQLYAVSTRFPRNLAKQVTLQPLKPGLYEVIWGMQIIRLIVLSEMENTESNAIWQLFSTKAKNMQHTATHYKTRSPEMSSIIFQLVEYYQQEKIIMSYTMQDFQRDYVKNHLNLLSPDDLIQGLSPDELIKRFSPDELLKNISFEDIKIWLEKQGKKVSDTEQ